MNITVGVLSFLWMLLLSSGDALVILEGGLRPPSFLMSLLVGVLSCPWMLLLLSVDTIAIVQGGLRPPSFFMSLLVRAASCLWMLLLSSAIPWPSATFFFNESPRWGLVLGCFSCDLLIPSPS